MEKSQRPTTTKEIENSINEMVCTSLTTQEKGTRNDTDTTKIKK